MPYLGYYSLKRLAKFVAYNILIFFVFFFSEKSLDISCEPADDSHEISRLVSSNLKW